MEEFVVDFNQFFFEEEDGPENPTLVSIGRLEKKTQICFTTGFDIFQRDILFEDESKDLLRERVRNLFHIISENSNIVGIKIRGDKIHIPGSLLAELIDWNKFISKVFFYRLNQSDMYLLCDAIGNSNIIETIGFENLHLTQPDLGLLSKAVSKNKTIESIEYCGGNNSLTFLQNILGPDSNIKSLTLDSMGMEDNGITIDYANQVGSILTMNSSLTSLKIENVYDYDFNMIPILNGLVNSNITNFHLSTNGFGTRESTIEYQNEKIDIISKMKQLKFFRIDLGEFSDILPEIMCSSLNGMCFLEYLEIHTWPSDSKILKAILQDMSKWERTYKLMLVSNSIYIEMIPLLKSVKMDSFKCYYVDNCRFEKIIAELPTWKFVRELEIQFNENVSLIEPAESHSPLEIEFAAAASKNSTLEQISIRIGDTSFFSVEVQNIIDKIIARNEHLAKCKENPEKVPLMQWPELLATADPTGLDFSYVCIRKIPDVFLGFLQCDVQTNNYYSDFVQCVQNKKRKT